jgi:Uma2 family endonuclease
MPDQPGKRELLRGELIEVPLAKFHHHSSGKRICARLDAGLAAAHARGEALELGEAYQELGYKLPDGVYVQQDVSVPFAGQPMRDGYLSGAPAIAIEIISPSNTAMAIDLKAELYFQHGAREVWRFYPKTRHVTVHESGKSRDVRLDEALTTPLIPGFALSVREILGE